MSNSVDRIVAKYAAKAKTYAQIHQEYKDLLKDKGWTLSGPLKIPYATSPSGKTRVWFKPQAVYLSVGLTAKDFGSARTLTYDDLKTVSPEEFYRMVERQSDSILAPVAQRMGTSFLKLLCFSPQHEALHSLPPRRPRRHFRGQDQEQGERHRGLQDL